MGKIPFEDVIGRLRLRLHFSGEIYLKLNFLILAKDR